MAEDVEQNSETAVEVSAADLNQIDEILNEADPAFVKDLKSINSNDLNNKEIGLPSKEDVAKKDKWYFRFWHNLDAKKQKLVVLVSFTVFIAIPGLLIAYFGVLTPEFIIAKTSSLESLADETIQLDPKVADKDLMELFLFDQFFLEVPEQMFVIKPRGDIKIGRFAFYLELVNREDTTYFKSHYEEVVEVLSRTLKQYSVDDFKGIDGKEEMRKIILTALNTRLEVKIKNIRYKLLVF